MAEKQLWDPENVRKAVLRETIQHPLTLLFASSAIMSSLYITLIQGSPSGLMIVLGSLGLTAGSWIVNYFLRTDHFVQKHFEKWQRQREKEQRRMLEELRKKFVEFKYEAGIREYDDLINVYNKFKQFLLSSNMNSLTSLQKVQLEGVAAETFDIGVQILGKLAALVTILHSVDIERYQKEIKDLDKEIKALDKKSDTGEDDRFRIQNLMKRRDAIKTRVDSFRQGYLETESLLARLEECENAIENSMLQMPVLSGKIDDQQLRRALSGMEDTVEAARRVSERIRQFETDDMATDLPGDDIYLQAGRQ